MSEFQSFAGGVEVRTASPNGMRECAKHGLTWMYDWSTGQPDPTGACGECFIELHGTNPDGTRTHTGCAEHGIVEISPEGGCPRCEATLRAVAGSSPAVAAGGAPSLVSLARDRNVDGVVQRSDHDGTGSQAGAAGGDRGRAGGEPGEVRGDGARGDGAGRLAPPPAAGRSVPGNAAGAPVAPPLKVTPK